MSDFIIHPAVAVIGEAESVLSRTRPLLAPAQPVLQTRRQEMNGKLRFHRAVPVKSNPDFYTVVDLAGP